MSKSTTAQTETAKTFEEQILELLERNPDFDPATVARIASQKKNADNAKVKKEKIKEARALIEQFHISHNAVFPSKPWIEEMKAKEAKATPPDGVKTAPKSTSKTKTAKPPANA